MPLDWGGGVGGLGWCNCNGGEPLDIVESLWSDYAYSPKPSCLKCAAVVIGSSFDAKCLLNSMCMPPAFPWLGSAELNQLQRDFSVTYIPSNKSTSLKRPEDVVTGRY